ncbi:formylmethanofuran dehydrogenase subunit E [Desulfarculales bacterium]
MDPAILPPDLQEAVPFHSHLCPGLLIGYRAAKAAVQALSLTRSQDKELVVVENDFCRVDDFQALLGTTFSKGNLKWLDYDGKQVFTLSDRWQNRTVRVAFTGDVRLLQRADGSVDREAFNHLFLEALDQDILKIEEVESAPPDPVRIEPSQTCARCPSRNYARCGEVVQESKAVRVEEQKLCRPCALKA